VTVGFGLAPNLLTPVSVAENQALAGLCKPIFVTASPSPPVGNSTPP
jgi:hypothetical protein